MLMLLNVHVTRVLFLVLAGIRPDYGLLLELHALTLVLSLQVIHGTLSLCLLLYQ